MISKKGPLIITLISVAYHKTKIQHCLEIVRRANAEVGPSGLPLYSAKLKAKFVKKEGGGDFFLKKIIIILKLAGRHLITKVSNLYLKCVHSARAANRD